MPLDLKLLRLKQSEPGPTQSVVRFQTTFEDDPKTYSYAAIKASGKWYVTGRASVVGLAWPDLLDRISLNGATIATAQLATTLEDL